MLRVILLSPFHREESDDGWYSGNQMEGIQKITLNEEFSDISY